MNEEITPEDNEEQQRQRADDLNSLTRKIYGATAIILIVFILIEIVIYFTKSKP